MRNMWHIMKTFQVLPTNEDFRRLTNAQIDLMLYSLEEDYREADLARRGLTVDSQYYDTSFEEEVWNKDVGDWEVLKEGHDPNDIARQVEELTREEDLKNLISKFDNLEEYNAYLEAGGKTTRETEVESYINNQIKIAEDKARMLEAKKGKGDLVDDRDIAEDRGNNKMSDLDKEAIDKSIALFNAEIDDDDEYTAL